MPYAVGGNLRDRLEQFRSSSHSSSSSSGEGFSSFSSPAHAASPSPRLPLSEALPLLAGIARGMSAVHAHGIIHLDLKPENILLGKDETPWITDFGLATSENEGSFSNSAGGRGTIQYKAPELFRSKKKGGAVVSPAADVYSFAVLAWQVCTGAVPWAGEMDTEISEGLKDGDRPEIQGVDDWKTLTHPDIAVLIERCWAQDHEARPAFPEISIVLEEMQVQQARQEATVAEEQRVLDAYQRGRDEAERLVNEMRARIVEYEAAVAAERAKQTLKEEQLSLLRQEVDGMRINVSSLTGKKNTGRGRGDGAAESASSSSSILNSPGRWNFFLSHTQRSGRATTLATKLFSDLGDAW